jgi:hypothetical protein
MAFTREHELNDMSGPKGNKTFETTVQSVSDTNSREDADRDQLARLGKKSVLKVSTHSLPLRCWSTISSIGTSGRRQLSCISFNV